MRWPVMREDSLTSATRSTRPTQVPLISVVSRVPLIPWEVTVVAPRGTRKAAAGPAVPAVRPGVGSTVGQRADAASGAGRVAPGPRSVALGAQRAEAHSASASASAVASLRVLVAVGPPIHVAVAAVAPNL